MATGTENILRRQFKSFFDEEKISSMALELEVCKRKRKFDPYEAVLAFALCHSKGINRTIEDARRLYCENAGEIAKSSFYEHLNPEMAQLMKRLVEDVCRNHWQSIWPLVEDGVFNDVFIQDSSVITLKDRLEWRYPSCGIAGSRTKGKKKAALKLHVGMHPLAVAPRTISVTSQRYYDADHLLVDEPMRGSLILFDRGYCRYALFDEIDEQGAFFVTRHKKSCNPKVVRNNLLKGKKAKKEAGIKVRELLARAEPGRTLDYEVHIEGRFSKAKNRGIKIDRMLRFVAVWNDEKKQHHCYITNLPSKKMSAEALGRWYACRWEIEIMFKILKSYFKIDQLTSGDDSVTQIQLYGALLGWLLCRTVQFALMEAYGYEYWRCPFMRFASIFFRKTSILLHAIKTRSHKTVLLLQEDCVREMKDEWINRKRNIQPQILELAA